MEFLKSVYKGLMADVRDDDEPLETPDMFASVYKQRLDATKKWLEDDPTQDMKNRRLREEVLNVSLPVIDLLLRHGASADEVTIIGVLEDTLRHWHHHQRSPQEGIRGIAERVVIFRWLISSIPLHGLYGLHSIVSKASSKYQNDNLWEFIYDEYVKDLLKSNGPFRGVIVKRETFKMDGDDEFHELRNEVLIIIKELNDTEHEIFEIAKSKLNQI